MAEPGAELENLADPAPRVLIAAYDRVAASAQLRQGSDRIRCRMHRSVSMLLAGFLSARRVHLFGGVAGWRRVEDIIAYNLAVQLRDGIIAVTSEGVVERDYRFRDQIRGAAASAVNNLAEGFARFNHGEFAFFANVAKASLAETRAELEDGLRRGYFVQADYDRLHALAMEAGRVASGLVRQLKSTKTPRFNPKSAHRG